MLCQNKLAMVAALLVAACGSSATVEPIDASIDVSIDMVDARPTVDSRAQPAIDAHVGPDARPGIDSGPGSIDAHAGGGPDASTFTEAAHAPFPSVTYQGAPILTAPYVVSITFKSDALAADLDAFGQSVASSAWWNTIRAGLCESDGTTCVGDGPAGTSVVLTTAAKSTYTDSQIQTFLAGLISAGTVPAPTANTIYTIYFPSTTTISAFNLKSCDTLDAYHYVMSVAQKPVYYSVVVECAPYNPPGIPPITLLQYTTLSASHEVAEAATDPNGEGAPPGGGPTFAFYVDKDNPQNWGWIDYEDAEVADLCVDAYGLGGDETLEGGYMVQRIWSIGNAAAGKNPCVPIPAGEVYFNVAPTTSVLVIGVSGSRTTSSWTHSPTRRWRRGP